MKSSFELNYFLDLSYDVGGFRFGCNLIFDESIQNKFNTAFGIFSEMSTGEVGSLTTINYKRQRMIHRSYFSHSLQGLSLLRNCLDELPQDRKATIAGDMGELKRELREKVILLEMVVIMTMRRWKIT